MIFLCSKVFYSQKELCEGECLCSSEEVYCRNTDLRAFANYFNSLPHRKFDFKMLSFENVDGINFTESFCEKMGEVVSYLSFENAIDCSEIDLVKRNSEQCRKILVCIYTLIMCDEKKKKIKFHLFF